MPYSRHILNPVVASLLSLLLIAGCGSEAGVCDNVQCPGGYYCVENNGMGACVGPDASTDMGKIEDIGPRLDKTKPTPDKGKKLDKGQTKDLKVPPKDLPGKKDGATPPKDKGPQPDQPVGGPISVTLLSPNNNSTSSLVEVSFSFKATATTGKIASCELWMNSALQGTVSNPAATAAINKKGLKDGKYTWSIKCKNVKGQAGGSTIWTLNIAPEGLTACKGSGFTANTRYKVMSAVTSTGGDCFVVDAKNVHLDGNNMAVTVPRYKDLLVHRGSTLYPSVYKNPGATGSWVKTWSTPYSDTVDATPTAADFNGDGRLDLVLPATSGNLRVFRSAGSGSFHSTPYYTSNNKKLTNPRAVDWNQDGAMDLVAAGNNASEELALNKGLAGLLYTFGYNWGAYTTNMDVGDITGDQVMDLVVGGGLSWFAEKRQVMRGVKSSSSFGFSTAWSASNNDARGSGASLIADLDGDGDLDLVLPYILLNNKRTRVFFNNGSGTSFSTSKSFSDTWPLAARDINGDGHVDLVLLHGNGTSPTGVQVNLNNGKGGFSGSKTVGAGGDITSSLLRDLDGDGAPDLVLGTSSSKLAYVRVFKNQYKTSGSFQLNFNYLSKGSGYILDARDMNNDGLLDLVSQISSTSSATSSVMLHSQNASGSYTTSTVLSSTTSTTPYFAAILGDLTANQANAVHVKKGADSITISNLGPIRGFSTGVLVEGDAATVEGVVVVDPDLYGVRFDGVNSGTVSGLKVSQLFQGTALSMDNAKIITVSNSTLCDGGQDKRLTPMGASCVMSAANGSNNRLNRNNGCTTLAYKPCP